MKRRAGRGQRTRTAARPILLMPATVSAAGAGIYVTVGPREGRGWIEARFEQSAWKWERAPVPVKALFDSLLETFYQKLLASHILSPAARLERSRIDFVLNVGNFGLPLKPQ